MCTPIVRRRYLARLSGPLLDRVDLQIRVRRITAARLRTAADGLGGDRAVRDTASVAERVVVARAAALTRLAGTPWRRNAEVSGRWLRGGDGGIRLPAATTAALDRALERGAITMRGYDRVLRIAWTNADLDGAGTPGPDHVGLALAMRSVVAA